MKNKVIWTKKALKQLTRIDSRYTAKVKNTAEGLANYPDVALDIVSLKGQKGEVKRLRVGDYRVIFEVIDGKPKIVEIQEVLRRSTNTYN